MTAGGAATAILLWRLVELIVPADALPYFYLPVAVAGVAACYLFGKHAARVLARMV